MQLSQAREGYLHWLLATRDLSPHTVRAYEGDLASFERFASTGTQVEDLNRSILIEFLESQRALHRIDKAPNFSAPGVLPMALWPGSDRERSVAWRERRDEARTEVAAGSAGCRP